MRGVRRGSTVITAAAVAATLAIAGAVGPAAAGEPLGVTIVSPMHFNQDDFNTGTFEASGPAVDAGLVCPSGDVVDTRLIFAGGQSGRGAQIPVSKTFTCDDGGSFFVKIQVHLNFETSTETFSWVIQGGTGPYADLRGSGTGSTVSDGSDLQTGNINTYVGFAN